MAMSFFNLQKSKPFVQINWMNNAYRVAVLWDDGLMPSVPMATREEALEEQQFMEYQMGMPAWIQRKVVNHFNTFSTECWV